MSASLWYVEATYPREKRERALRVARFLALAESADEALSKVRSENPEIRHAVLTSDVWEGDTAKLGLIFRAVPKAHTRDA